MAWRLVWLPAAVVALSSCRSGGGGDVAADGGKAIEIRVTSTAFADGAMIPATYTCDGVNVSPPLAWTNVPTGAKTIALICDDPDAPSRVWVHWVLYDLPANVTSLPEGIGPEKQLASGAKQGASDFGKIGYGGPCPPSGTHRYFFKLYALDTELSLGPGATKPQLVEAMKGHVLAEGELVGKYSRR